MRDYYNLCTKFNFFKCIFTSFVQFIIKSSFLYTNKKYNSPLEPKLHKEQRLNN